MVITDRSGKRPFDGPFAREAAVEGVPRYFQAFSPLCYTHPQSVEFEIPLHFLIAASHDFAVVLCLA